MRRLGVAAFCALLLVPAAGAAPKSKLTQERATAIFVANPRHDRVHSGDPLLYVILARPNPTRYDVMQPGLVTTAAVQGEIVRSLERSHTRVCIEGALCGLRCGDRQRSDHGR